MDWSEMCKVHGLSLYPKVVRAPSGTVAYVCGINGCMEVCKPLYGNGMTASEMYPQIYGASNVCAPVQAANCKECA